MSEFNTAGIDSETVVHKTLSLSGIIRKGLWLQTEIYCISISKIVFEKTGKIWEKLEINQLFNAQKLGNY